MQNSPNQQDPDQDERKNSGMEDSTLMTIEFLRARLLSERSVSRAARLRADELAERVVELEEQLKVVSLQRKKAEKAASDVLSILENNGISEFSEDFDSTSDQEVIPCESKVGNNSPEEEGSSVGLKMRRNHADDFYGSELESSPLPGRSLSWKSGKDSLRSHEKKYVDSPRRRSSSASTMSASARRRIGKSCRQLRRRETRSGVEESQSDNSMLAPQLNGIATFSEGFPTHSDIGPEILRESCEQDADTFLGGPVAGDLENQRTVANVSNYLKANGSDKDMERALEHQAQLIGQYVEEEKAQREWEEKFRENNSSTPDSCEPGNHSDITEERDEPKAHAPPHNGTLASQDQEAKSNVEDIRVSKYSSKSQSNGFQSSPRVDLVCLQDQKSPASDFEFPVAMGKQDQQRSTKYSTMPPQGQNHLRSHLEVPTGNQSPQIVSSHDYSVTPPQSQYHLRSKTEVPTGNQSLPIVPSHMGSSLREGETSSGSKNEHRALVPHETPDKLGSVLEALQQAKLSLQLKVNAFPPINSTPVGKAFESSVGGRPEVPVGSAGLFRVPSDFHVEAAAKATFPGSNSQLSLANYYPDAGNARTAGDRITGPFTESSSSVSTGNRNLAVPTSLYMESRSRIQTWEPLETWSRFSYRNPFFRPSLDTDITQSSRHALHDPNMDAALFASSTYASPAYSYPDQMPWMPSDEGRRLFSTTGSGIPPNQMPRMPSDEGRRLFSTTGSGIPPNQMPRRFSTTGSDEGQRHFSTAGAGIPRNLMPQKPSDEGRQLFSTTGAGIPPNLMPRMPSDEGQQHFSTAGAAIPPSLMPRMPFGEGQRLFSTTGAGIPPNLLPRMPSDEGQQHFSTARAGIPPSLMPRMPSDEGQRLFSTTGAGIPPSNRFSFYDDHSRPSMPSGSYNSPAYSYPDRTPRMPSDERPPLFSSSGAGIPPPNRFSFYDDNIRPGMYR